MSHSDFRLDDYHIWKEFWYSINSGYEDMEYKWKFEQFWGVGAKPETIILSQTDYDALQKRLAEPPQYNENLAKLLRKKSPWNEQ